MITCCRYMLICTVLFLLAGCAEKEVVEEEQKGSPAEKLVTMLPDDVLGFVATSGGQYLKPSFEKSILGRIWNDAGVQSFYQSVKKEIMAKVKQEAPDPDAAKLPDNILNLVRLVADRPVVFGAARKEPKGGPPVYGFAIVDAGGRKAEIASAVTDLEALVGEDKIAEIKVGSLKMRGPRDDSGVPGYWGWVRDYFVFAMNDGEGLAMKYLSNPRATAAAYLKDVPGAGDALAMYFDYEGVFGLLDTVLAQEEDLKDFKSFRSVLKELGLDSVKSATARVGFVGPDVVDNGFVAVPEPRTGLLASLRAIDPTIFDMVNAGAVNAAAFDCDIAGAYDTVMKVMSTAAPADVYTEIEQGIAGFEAEAKVSIRGGLLENLAGPIVFYSLPAGVIVEVPSGGFVVIAGLKDAAAFEKAMSALGQFASAKSGGMVHVSSQVQSDGRTYHSWVVTPLAMMQIMPCWTVVKDHIVIASNPGLCSKAVAQVVSTGSERKSVRTTEGYRQVTANLPPNLVFLSYTDSKVHFSEFMTRLQQFWPMITMGAAQGGVNLPVMLPSLADIVKDMGPSCQYSWFDSQGFRSHYQGPGLEMSLGAIAGASLGTAILMPALARTRQLAQRVVSENNLSGIGKACMVYANNDPEGKYPPSLQALVDKGHISPEQLESRRKPKDFAGPSYIYIAGQNAAMDPGNIIAYENPEFCDDRIIVLFNDTRVDAMRPEEFLEALEATYKRLGRQMPEIKFKDSKTGGSLGIRPISLPAE